MADEVTKTEVAKPAELVTVNPVFFEHSIQVLPDEAASLKSQGLLRPDPPSPPATGKKE